LFLQPSYNISHEFSICRKQSPEDRQIGRSYVMCDMLCRLNSTTIPTLFLENNGSQLILLCSWKS